MSHCGGCKRWSHKLELSGSKIGLNESSTKGAITSFALSDPTTTTTAEYKIPAETTSTLGEQQQCGFCTRTKRRRLHPYQSIVSNTIKEYCATCSIHGVHFIGECNRPWIERIFWILIYILSIYICYQLVYSTWRKWNETPVIVGFSERATPIWEVPFPAVTICPETKTEKRLFNFTKFYSKMMENLDNETNIISSKGFENDEFEKMEALLQVCESYLVDDVFFERSSSNVSNILNILQELAPVFNLTYPLCKWKNVVKSCEHLMFKVITEEGICYTFNGLNSTEIYDEKTVNYNMIWQQQERKITTWHLQGGYDKNAGADTYPERILGSGAKPGLFMVLQGFDYNMDYICRGPIQGFKVLLHSPDDIPQLSKQYFRIPYDKEVLVSVKPNLIETSDKLSDYSPIARQCYLGQERKLKYFKIYTQSNCELECLANFTIQKCNCVKFSMPRYSETPICDASSIRCYQNAEDLLMKKQFQEGLKGIEMNLENESKCNCLPTCTSLNYDAEISQADFDLDKLLNAFNDPYKIENPGVKMSRLSIFFKENPFISAKRSELYGIVDFMASCGGLFGMFMGLSAFSIVEVLYFFTIRLINNILRQNNTNEYNLN